MHKVVLLSGSPRSEGNTHQVLEVCKNEIEKQGLEAKILTLVGKDIKGCIACYRCGELGKCSLNDGLNEIIDEIRDAQGFIVGAPVYFGTPRGDLMNALQRIGMVSRSSNKFLTWKVGGPIAVARRGGITNSYQEMMMMFMINDMIVPGSTYWNIVFGGKTKGDAIKDEEGIATVTHFAANVAKLIKKINN
ncbi:MAG: flavodoxin family protein [Bacillota bacterium]